jgi:hypothetical protein
LRLARELNLELILFATDFTYDKIKFYIKKRKFSLDIKHFSIVELDDYFVHNFNIDKSDFFVMCAARSGSISSSINLDLFLPKIEKIFEANDKIIIYPSQEIAENIFSNYEDISADVISKGVETVQKIGKEVGNIFKK